MHIILIICDTLRRDFLGCYGNDWVQTPNIDALARSSLVFDAAYAGSFPTIPHRADLMTGRYVFHTTGWAPLPPGSIRVQEYLRNAGYVTQLISDHIQYLGPGMNYHAGFMGQQWVRGHQGDPLTTDDEPVEWPCDPAKIRQPEQLLAPHLRNRKGRRFEREWH